MRAIELNGVKPDMNKDAFTWGRLVVHDGRAVEALAKLPVNRVQSLDDMISRRAAFLTDYQNKAWAESYLATLAKIRTAETRVSGHAGGLTEAAAKGLFKLMSYKDEYEVARLHSQTGFYESLKDRFEGDFTIRHHLAPPMLPTGKDARGRPYKRAFGPWIQPALRQLAKMKGLRGTKLDVFGYSADRKLERGLIAEYRAVLDQLVQSLSAKNLAEATQIAGLVMNIRGYGPVKDLAVEQTRARIKAELDAFGT
jgi:indolepyruvate ferredoxin oxidoreductase